MVLRVIIACLTSHVVMALLVVTLLKTLYMISLKLCGVTSTAPMSLTQTSVRRVAHTSMGRVVATWAWVTAVHLVTAVWTPLPGASSVTAITL